MKGKGKGMKAAASATMSTTESAVEGEWQIDPSGSWTRRRTHVGKGAGKGKRRGSELPARGDQGAAGPPLAGEEHGALAFFRHR